MLLIKRERPWTEREIAGWGWRELCLGWAYVVLTGRPLPRPTEIVIAEV